MLLTLYLHLVGYDENGELSKLDGYANITSDDVDNFELDDLSDEDPRETTA